MFNWSCDCSISPTPDRDDHVIAPPSPTPDCDGHVIAPPSWPTSTQTESQIQH